MKSFRHKDLINIVDQTAEAAGNVDRSLQPLSSTFRAAVAKEVRHVFLWAE